MSKILLFYKYVTIENTSDMVIWMREICTSLQLTGRIIIATEGINATLGGSDKSIEQYIKTLNEHYLFKDIDFKTSPGDEKHFPRLRIVIKDEIVRLGIAPDKLKASDGGIHLTPQEAHNLMAENLTDLIILDTRNNYESRIGTFLNSITPNINTFRELPEYIDQNIEMFANKKVLMHCTGGVRCERATAYLKQKNIAAEIYQIQGGIHRYVEQFPDGFFRGSNYVFDGRIACRINNDILTTCDICSITCDIYNNCMNAQCNKRFIACQLCTKKLQETCSPECLNLILNNSTPLRNHSTRVISDYQRLE